MTTRILIADDHAIVREGIRNLIQTARPEWDICGEASDGEQALEMMESLQPTLVVLDITMPKISGLEVASRIAPLSPDSRILMFTMHESQPLMAEAQKMGAHGVVLKSQATRDLIRAIDRLISGGTFFPDEIPQQLEEPQPPAKPKGKWFRRSVDWYLNLPFIAHGSRCPQH